MSDIAQNLRAVKERIRQAVHFSQRSPDSVTLVAVSKVHASSAIREAYTAGQRHFGENYAQELKKKSAELADLQDIHWHFIGHLQRNKVKFVVPSASLIETVDSLRLIQELEQQAAQAERTIHCLVQVNVGGEEQKSGCPPRAAGDLLCAIEKTKCLAVDGLMTIPPWDLEPEQTRQYFRALRELRDALGGPKRVPELSMGMSQDYEIAIAEGATIVRVGTAIFGSRR